MRRPLNTRNGFPAPRRRLLRRCAARDDIGVIARRPQVDEAILKARQKVARRSHRANSHLKSHGSSNTLP
jgi:hypothetical protein